MDYLFIGGENDGRRIALMDELIFVELPRLTDQTAMVNKFDSGLPSSANVRRDVYRIKEIWCSRDDGLPPVRFPFYVESNLSLCDATEMLFARYNV